VFQAIHLQNLDIRKVTNSNIKIWVFENLKKSENGRGPLVSLRCRLNGSRSLASLTHDSCSAMRQWPEHRHGRRPRVPPHVPLSIARGCSGGILSHSDSSRHLTAPTPLSSTPCFAVVDHHLAASGHRRSPSTPPQRPPVSRPPSRAADLHHRMPPLTTVPLRPSRAPVETPCGETPPLPVTKSGPHLTGHLSDPRPHLTAPLLAGISGALERLEVPLSRPQVKRLRGLGRHGREGLWPSGLGPFQQCRFIFFSFRINSKFNSI
jgi:hypothetical protein